MLTQTLSGFGRNAKEELEAIKKIWTSGIKLFLRKIR